jgi:spore coat protein H
MKKILISVMILPIFLLGCTIQSKIHQDLIPKEEEVEITQNDGSLQEDKRVYQNDNPNSIVHLYVTVLDQSDAGGMSNSLFEMNQWYINHSNQLESPTLNVIVQEGDEKGPKKGSLGYQEKMANASFSIRGNSSKLEVQKSYKIKLNDRPGLWKGQKVINLNKHVDDLSRVKNKLSFDYFQKIPELPSVRTQFVHLHIKDLSTSPIEKEYKSYGLYTHVEQVNERYLSSHGLNPYGHIYKVVNFEFRLDESKIKTEDDPDFDKKKFETSLEIKGNNDHSKLIGMLKDLNNPNNNINDLISRYFDRENLLSWLAINILFGNIDTEVNNYYLYSYPSSEKWYFIPWDYDKAWGWHTDKDQNIPTWQTGIARYWGTLLHNRFLRDPNNVAALNEKIEELSTVITKDQTMKLLEGYKSVVKPLVSQAPDMTFYPTDIKKFEQNYNKLISQPEMNKKVYYEQLEFPMPIYLGDPTISNQTFSFDWDHSYHLKGDDLFYTFQLSKDIEFNNILIEHKNLTSTNTKVEHLNKGRYFWRVLITDTKGHTQIPFDYYISDGMYYWGLKELIIK